MRILLANTLPYLRSFSGASRGDRRLLEGLVERGNCCRVLTLANDRIGRAEAAPSFRTIGANVPRVHHHNGVDLHEFSDIAQLCVELSNQIREFEPDWTLISEDRSYLCLATALEASSGHVVYLCHSQATLPFGPEAFMVDPSKSVLLRKAAGVIAPSGYVKDYLRRWGGLDPSVIPLPIYEPPFPHCGCFDAGAIAIVNPSAIKGISIFLGLAGARPDLPFMAVASWATTAHDRDALDRLPNVQLLEPTETIDDIYARTRVLLVPSLWGEAFGYVVVEAMLRGIPVIASDIGGLPEAKLGIDYLLPVTPIERYEERLDERSLPVPDVPEQDITPWLAALDALLSSRETYERVSGASRKAALAFVERMGIAPFERYLEDLAVKCKAAGSVASTLPQERIIENLSPERRKLLDLLLHKREAALDGR